MKQSLALMKKVEKILWLRFLLVWVRVALGYADDGLE